MTVIRPNSISGISSITGQGGDITIFRADGTTADVIVNNITSGIITATHYGSGANLTSLPAGQLTGTVADARLSTVSSSKLSGALPALDGSALTGVGASFGNSSVNTSGIITATSFVPTTGQLSHRNLIINGDMRVAQRGVSTTSNGYGFVDRFQTSLGSLSTGGNVTRSQQSLSSSDTGPWQAGFRKYARMATVGAGTANANGYIEIYTRLEAQDIANSGWDYKSTSGKITLSFWFRCSANQTFYAYLMSSDGTSQSYPFSFTASGNNTWTKITHTIPGNSNLTFDNDNGSGLTLYWIPFFGTDYTNNKTLNTWSALDQNNQIPDMASTWLTSGAATWDITGIQLEVGPVATPFEHISIAENKRRCYRYCQRGRHISSCLVGTPGTYYFSRGYINLFTPMRATISGTLKAATWNLNRYFQYMTWSSGTNVTAAPASVTFSSLSISDASSDIVGCVLHISISSGSSNSPLPANGPGSNNVYPIEYYDVLLEAEL
jgi:hypothetical protein